MNTVRALLVAFLSAASGSCCYSAHRPSIAANEHDPFTVVRDSSSGSLVAYGKLSSIKSQLHGQAGPAFRVTLSTPTGFATGESVGPATALPALSNACVPVRLNVHGKGVYALPIFIITADYENIYGALIDADGRASACVPAAPYFISMDEGDRFSIDRLVEVRQGASTFDVSTFSKEEVQTPPTFSGPLPTKSAIRASDIADGVRIIGYGEPDHGGREYLDGRLAFLLDGSRSGIVDKVVIEAGPAEVFALDDYIAGSPVDVRAAVAELGYWIWDTEDFLRALDALRKHNESNPHKVRMFGADVQRTQAGVRYLLEQASKLRLDERGADLLQTLDDEKGTKYGALTANQRTDLRALLERIIASFPATTEMRAQRTKLVAMALRSRCDYFESEGMLKHLTREVGMASLVSEVASRGGKTVYWAHNGHVARMFGSGLRNTGLLLAERWGKRYHVVGVFAASGVSRAWDADQKVGVEPTPLPSLPPAYFESVVTKLAGKREVVVLDLHRLPEAMARWLATPRRVRDFGAVYPGLDDASRLYLMVDAFDHAMVLRDVAPTTPTATGVRRPNPPAAAP